MCITHSWHGWPLWTSRILWKRPASKVQGSTKGFGQRERAYMFTGQLGTCAGTNKRPPIRPWAIKSKWALPALYRIVTVTSEDVERVTIIFKWKLLSSSFIWSYLFLEVWPKKIYVPFKFKHEFYEGPQAPARTRRGSPWSKTWVKSPFKTRYILVGLKIRWNARPLFAGPPSPLLRLDIDRCIIPLFDIVLSRPPYLQFSFRSTARATVTVKTSAPQLLTKSLKNTLLVMP